MIETKRLSNGIQVVFESMQYLKTVSFGVWVKVGSSHETTKNNGIAHVIEHMMFKGTTKRDARQLADDMAKIGGNVNAYTSKECTSYYTATLSEHLGEAIEIIGDMLTNSIIDSECLEKEKGVILEEIDMYDDSPEDLVHEVLQQMVWKDHPLGYIISGTKEIVNGLSSQEILDFIHTHYVAENMLISIAGHFNEDQVMMQLEEAFGEVPHGVKQEDCEIPVFNRCFYTKEKDVEQVHLNLAYDSIKYDDAQKYTLSILNSILGGNINSRLFLKIREDMGLTYSIYSYGSSHVQAGLFHIYAAMNPSQTEMVLKLIFEVIDDLIEHGIEEDELIMTIEQIKTDLVMGSESAKGRMNRNAKAYMTRGFVVPMEEILDYLNRVTSDDLVSFARKYFAKEKASIALVGNLDGIKVDHIKKMMNF